MSAPAVAVAADDPDGAEPGQLTLNTAVLNNDSVGGGYAGDFAVRGRLFSSELSAQAELSQDRATQRLAVVHTLDFSSRSTSPDPYAPLRAALFDDYVSHEVLQTREDAPEVPPQFFGVVAVLTAPLVVLAGALLGRAWTRRRRAVR